MHFGVPRSRLWVWPWDEHLSNWFRMFDLIVLRSFEKGKNFESMEYW